jgi:hypothetical protein
MSAALKRCDQCGALATKGVFNYEEIPALPGDRRDFQKRGPERLGCDSHPPESFTYYLDGRKIETRKTVPEWVPYA